MFSYNSKWYDKIYVSIKDMELDVLEDYAIRHETFSFLT